MADLNTEQHRHRCEVRWLITNGAEFAQQYARAAARSRGPQAGRALQRDVKSQGLAGNTGAWGMWIENEKDTHDLSR